MSDPIGGDLAVAFCWMCAGGSRPLPYEQHGVTAYLHHSSGGERLLCISSGIRLLEDDLGKLRQALVDTVAAVHADDLTYMRRVEAQRDAALAALSEARRVA